MAIVAGSDIHVIACRRGSLPTGQHERVFGVRWAGRPDLGFPSKGFVLRRIVAGAPAPVVVGRYFLPPTTDWATFKTAAEQRRPAMGPYFPDFLPENLEYLLPIVRLADPGAPAAELPGLVERAADFFGGIHTGDPALAWALWPDGNVPSLPALLADPAARAALTSFYRARCTAYLLALALRFEYAVLFGLATDDLAPAGNAAVSYQITGEWSEAGTSTTDLDVPKPPCEPPPPAEVTATRIPGNVAHPAFRAFGDWVPPAPLAPADQDGVPLPATATVPRVPAALTGLSWSAQPPSPRLIGYGAALYLVDRFDFGADTAELEATPPLPAGAQFTPLFDGEPLLRPAAEPHTVDRPGMDWPPLEGHYSYDVKGVSLLGFVSKTGARASVRHHDDLAPVPPRARLAGGPALTVGPAGTVTAEIGIDWASGEDFVSPDVVDFRVAGSFRPLDGVAVEVTELLSANPLVCTVRVAALAGPSDAYAGRRLILPNGEFVIVSHGSGGSATMTVRRSAGRTPAVGVTGVVFVPGAPTALTRVARLQRLPATPARVESLVSADPADLRLRLSADPTAESGRIYLHLLRTTFDAERTSDGYRVTAPPAEGPGAQAWERWLGLPDPATAIVGSPALFFPPHHVTVTVAVPVGFVGGSLTFHVTAADGTPYVTSPALPASEPALIGLRGNESAAAAVVASVRRPTAPEAPVSVDPAARLWATSAASYAEAARFDVRWAPVAGAIRYEIWRAFEGALAGASAATNDAQLRALAAAQPDAFELRSGEVFGTHHVDELPGLAPTRVVYRVRAVSAAGVAGVFSGVIGPVYVPDVRPPPAPNLVRVVATKPAEADRGIAVEWSQAALDGDIGFEVEVRATDLAAPFTTAGVVGPGATPVAGRFRFVHHNRIPGRRYEYRVVAVREALDPADPAAAARRPIRSHPSATRTGVAISTTPPGPPAGVTALWDAAMGAIRLTWSNAEAYDALLVYRRAPGRFGFERVVMLDGTAVAHHDPGLAAGTWAYQLRARTATREARSATVEVTVP
ncbi:hypothetical protein [Asanoa iriomotensis]|uniref:Fibronectin type III domain protein n=1 Tax=Asanoa iriomotensis TaxID=234613 RepID=A0ABQ4BZ25_9ACTN|nr:hypothetical protein [Asanoa iriomotensis]GIF55786.1 hypothetical protein Air01nite_18810 [Asanoa iriomotensis]